MQLHAIGLFFYFANSAEATVITSIYAYDMWSPAQFSFCKNFYFN